MPYKLGDTTEVGASTVELAIIGPLLAVVAFASVEFGLLYSHAQSLSSLARAGARMASATGAAPTDDYDILRSVKVGGKSPGEGDVQRVIVYKANGSDGSVPTQCLTGSVVGLCNVYSAADLNRTKAEIDARQTAWPPASRSPGSDYVGVSVTSTHTYLTGIFGKTRTVSDAVVMQIEPSSDSDDTTIGNMNTGSVSFAPDAPTASGYASATSQYDVPGFTPGVVAGFTPGVVPGFTPGVVDGYTPGVVAGYTPGVVDGYTPGVVDGYTPGVVDGYTPGVVDGFVPGVDGVRPPETTPPTTTPAAPSVATPQLPAAPTPAAPPATSAPTTAAPIPAPVLSTGKPVGATSASGTGSSGAGAPTVTAPPVIKPYRGGF